MGAEHPAERFLRHRGLILVAAGGAVAEAGALTLFAPAARPVAPQVTALPSLAAYHDLRWLFADGQSWLGFAVAVAGALLVRAALDAALLRLAWPRGGQMLAPRASRAFWSCLAATVLAWLLLSPAATLVFGVAVLPFSWPFFGALPIAAGVTLVLSHGGALVSWWRRLPPPRAVAWLLASFAALSAAAAVIAHLDTAGVLAVAAVTGLVNARAWYGLAGIAAGAGRLSPGEAIAPAPLGMTDPRPVIPDMRAPAALPARVLPGLPLAPIAGLLVLALVAGVARLMFTGTIRVSGGNPAAASGAGNAASAVGGAGGPAGGPAPPAVSQPGARLTGAVLVVAGWGSSCCDAAGGLRAALPQMLVRQFSYLGMNAAGQPRESGPEADNLPLPVLGDRMAAQLMRLHAESRQPVDIVAESEGTLGVYAMLGRHPDLPVGSIVLLSPIVGPGRPGFAVTPGGGAVPGAALRELNRLVGGISPYGSSGAGQLLGSVSEFGARYFAAAVARAPGQARTLAVIPLADALTLPVCRLPRDVVVVPAFHGGLLGNPRVLPMVGRFLATRAPADADGDQERLHTVAEAITGAASAWRMPETSAACPGS